MSLIALVIVLIVIGVLMWLLNSQLGAVIDSRILKIINVVVIVAVVLWLLSILGLFDSVHQIKVPRIGG